jgi:hypothetical protein
MGVALELIMMIGPFFWVRLVFQPRFRLLGTNESPPLGFNLSPEIGKIVLCTERSDQECRLQWSLTRKLLQLNNLTNVSPTRFGLAFPLESFMTCPFRKLMAAALPAL